MSDLEACDQGIAALIQLYGEHQEAEYEPACIACRASVLIRDMRALRADLLPEPAA